ncbi:hypothetical protein [Evansella halocellulosilytica]|uniref:hypothetical protein n=1 Tax=Evansella halocellulosilytica TaxID=2011013 RepID=UPI00211C3AD7|nr:hypothetical protein [Evansella halocellulosilytica]
MGILMLTFLIFYTLLLPMCVLLHEVGHGIGVVLSSKSHARIYLGDWDKENKHNFSIGRLHFYIRWSFVGFCAWDDRFEKQQRIAALAGGPIMSLLLVCLFGLLMAIAPQGDIRFALTGVTIFNLIQFFVTAIPMTYPHWMGAYKGHPSDGLQLLRLLRS